MATNFDDIYAKLHPDTRSALARAALCFPRLARGHGSLRKNECNATGCDGKSHTQERTELAYKVTYGK